MRFRISSSSVPLLALGAALILLTGCEKIKALTARKARPPQNAAAAATPAPAKPGAAAPAPTPAKPPAPAVPRGDTGGAVAVLCYHRFENGKGQLIISPAEFDAQMKKLKDSGLGVISMRDFLAWRKGEKSIPPRSVVITLDDGWVSGYTDAWPILKKYNFPFTMFIYTDYVRGGPRSGGKSMTWEQLEEMRDAGVDIECHTTTHSDLRAARHKLAPDQYAAYLQTELGVSRDVIEQRLAIKVDALAYPYGNYNEQVEAKVKELNYTAAFTVNPQKITFGSPPATLGRYAIDGLTPKVFDLALNFGAGSSGPASTETAPMAASSMMTVPAEGETVNTATPVIQANLQALGKFDPKTVEMLISGFGLVPAKYDPATGLVRYQPATPLEAKSYTVIVHATIDGKKVGTRWNFTVAAK